MASETLPEVCFTNHVGISQNPIKFLPEKNNSMEEIFVLTHTVRDFNPWIGAYISMGLW
jgi:hypothetical protein